VLYNHPQVHFLNVDHGDCTIVRHPGDQHRDEGRISIIDINDWPEQKEYVEEDDISSLEYYRQFPVKDDQQDRLSGIRQKSQISPEEYAQEYLNDPIEYYNKNFDEVTHKIWRFIATHPDMDHLSGLNRLEEEIGFSVFWDTDHNRERDEDNWYEVYEWTDWELYEDIREGDTDHDNIQPTQGQQKKYWKHDNIEILHPSPEFIQELNDQNAELEDPEYNDYSYVLKIQHGTRSILLPGDAEEDVWDEILEEWEPEVLEDVHVLKAAHHGRKDGFHREAVEAMDPAYVIVSVGKKDDQDAYDNYRSACSDETEILSTRQYGRIKAICTRPNSIIIDKAEPDGIFDLPDD